MDESQDIEVTLGTGRLLMVFFALVALCAGFFSFGYAMGRSSAPTITVGASSIPLQPMTTTGKPAAGKTAQMTACDRPEGCGEQQTASADLTFYRSVDQNMPTTDLTQPVTSTPVDPNTTITPVQPPISGGYIVQIAAVSEREDAEALAEALRNKQYTPFIAAGEGDRLLRIQVGPYADIKEAEAIRARLMRDGYSPILKK
jgi:DedD protein